MITSVVINITIDEMMANYEDAAMAYICFSFRDSAIYYYVIVDQGIASLKRVQCFATVDEPA